MKTSELTGAALDWAVCIAEYGYGADYKTNRYSTDWAQGGPIIEREICEIIKGGKPTYWEARAGFDGIKENIMSNDTYHTDIYTHKSGKKYHVELYYDHDMGAPQEEGDGYGVTERINWNPTDEEQLEQHLLDYELELEEETRLRMMRRLQPPSNWADSGLYYDVLSSLHKAREDGWGAGEEWKAANPTATKEEELMYVVNKDFEHLYGWYHNDWHWVTVSVAPLDEDGEPMEDHREYCGGYESTITDSDQRKWFDEVIEDLAHSVEHSLKKVLHKGQMELELV